MNQASQQPSLLDYRPPLPIETIDHHVDRSDQTRLRGQNLAILKRLLAGPATNDELAKLSRKYTSRISDVRAWLQRSGSTIECQRGEGGLNTYAIVTVAGEPRERAIGGGNQTQRAEDQPMESMPDQITCPKTPCDQHGDTIAAQRRYLLSLPGSPSLKVDVIEDPEDGELYMRSLSTGHIARVNTSNPRATWEWVGKASRPTTEEGEP